MLWYKNILKSKLVGIMPQHVCPISPDILAAASEFLLRGAVLAARSSTSTSRAWVPSQFLPQLPIELHSGAWPVTVSKG